MWRLRMGSSWTSSKWATLLVKHSAPNLMVTTGLKDAGMRPATSNRRLCPLHCCREKVARHGGEGATDGVGAHPTPFSRSQGPYAALGTTLGTITEPAFAASCSALPFRCA